MAWGVGAVLIQQDKPTAFYGRRLSQQESAYKGGVMDDENNFTVTEQEMLAVVEALREWRCYLDGQVFIIVTDHKPNTFFEQQKSLSRRQARWAEELSRFNYHCVYRPGRKNVADPISRNPLYAAVALFCAVPLALKVAAAQTSMSMEEAELDGLEPEEIYEALFEAEPSSAPEAEGESGWDELVHKFLPA